MKWREFIHQLVQDGCVLLRSGSRHDIYLNPKTGQNSLCRDTQNSKTIS